MDANLSKNIIFGLATLTIFCFSVSANDNSNSLDNEDIQANEFIGNALEKQPTELPEIDDNYYKILDRLEAARSKVKTNQTEVIKKQSVSIDIPQIKSITKKPIEERAALYRRLADQTGLSFDEISASNSS